MAKIYYESSLSHKGIKGMKWGFNDGKRNGKRTAEKGTKFAFRDEDGDIYRKVTNPNKYERETMEDGGWTELYKSKKTRYNGYSDTKYMYVKQGEQWADLHGSMKLGSTFGSSETYYVTKGRKSALKAEFSKAVSKAIDAGKNFVSNLLKKLGK